MSNDYNTLSNANFGQPNVPLAVIEVEHGKRYRFRLVSIAFDAFHGFSIDGHDLTIIEVGSSFFSFAFPLLRIFKVDGINTQPHTVNYIEIHPAQRYSFVLHADQKIDNYRVRALSSTGVGASNFTNGVNSGILRYKGARDVEPTTSQSSQVVALRESDLHPLEKPGAPGKPYPGGADVVLNFTISFNAETHRFTMNNVTYVPPTTPVLLQILSGAQHAQDLLPEGSVYGLPRNKVIEINFFGGNVPSGGPHPFHLHGVSGSSLKYNLLFIQSSTHLMLSALLTTHPIISRIL